MAAANRPLVWLRGEFKTLPGIGRGVHELRIADAEATWRIIYRLDTDAIVIGEVFAKKTAQTPQRVMESCRRRFRAYDTATEE